MQHEDLSARTVDINAHYWQGALAHRLADMRDANPYQPGTMAAEHWQQGYRNEQHCLHVVEGTDIITSEFEGRFALRMAPGFRLQPRKTYLSYAHALMVATGMYDRALPMVKKKPFITDLQLRNALQAQGDVLSSGFAALIRERIKLDARKRGASLTAGEMEALEKVSPGGRSILLAIGQTQDLYYDRLVRNEMIAKLFKKPPEWTAKMLLCSVRRGGLLSTIHFNRQTCTLTPKGWRAVQLIQQSTMIVSANNNEISERDLDDDLEVASVGMRL